MMGLQGGEMSKEMIRLFDTDRQCDIKIVVTTKNLQFWNIPKKTSLLLPLPTSMRLCDCYVIL